MKVNKMLRCVMGVLRLCHIVTHTILTHTRILALVVVALLATLAVVAPSLLLDLAVRGGIVAGGVALTLATRSQADTIAS